MADLSIPLQGMMNAEARVNTAAVRIASMPLSVQTPAPAAQDTVDLSAEMVALMQAKNDYKANANVAKTFDEMNQSVLNLLG